MEEIIIDGINVTECEFYDNGSCRECDMRVPFYSDIDCYDECNKNCYYKQLKRLEQENKMLQELKDEDSLRVVQLAKENAELKETIQELNKAIQECNIQRTRLYKALEEIRGILQENCNQCFEIDNFTKPDDCGICEWARVLKVINEVLNEE